MAIIRLLISTLAKILIVFAFVRSIREGNTVFFIVTSLFLLYYGVMLFKKYFFKKDSNETFLKK